MSSLQISRTWLLRDRAERDPDLLRKIDDGIHDGLCWLQSRFTMRHNWPESGWPYYVQYSLEKAFEIGQIERIGGHDWWSVGATELLLREKPGGGWGNEPYESALAVLFLTRATAEPEFEVREGGPQASGGSAKPEDEDAVVVEGIGLVGAREVIKATEVRDPEKRKARIEIAEKAVKAIEEERRPIVVPALGKLLASGYPECKRLAEKHLRALAGDKLDDEAAALEFFKRWDETTRIGTGGDFDRIPFLRDRLRGDALPGVRRTAALALSRLRAVEAVPDLISELERPGAEKDYKGYIRQILVGTAGKDAGEDPQAWRAFWKDASPPILAREELRRDVQRLGRTAAREEARDRLRKLGKNAVRTLIDTIDPATSDPQKRPDPRAAAVRAEAAMLLHEITGRDLGEDRAAWESWWREEGKRP